jgi:hypothetical protein
MRDNMHTVIGQGKSLFSLSLRRKIENILWFDGNFFSRIGDEIREMFLRHDTH